MFRPLSPATLESCGGCCRMCCFSWLLLTLYLFAHAFTLHLDMYHCEGGPFLLMWCPKQQVTKPSSHAQSLCSSRLWNLLRKPKWARKNTENNSAYNISLVRMFSQEGGLILPRTQTHTLLSIGEASFHSSSFFGSLALQHAEHGKQENFQALKSIASKDIKKSCSKNQWCSEFNFRNKNGTISAGLLRGHPNREQSHFWSDDELKK